MKLKAIPWAIRPEIKKLISCAALTSLAVMSCNKKEPEARQPLDCGCDSDSIGYVSDALGSWRSDGISGAFVLYDSLAYTRFLHVSLCEPEKTLEGSPFVFTFNYQVSGVLRASCPPFPGIDLSPSWVPSYKLSNPVIIKLKAPYQL